MNILFSRRYMLAVTAGLLTAGLYGCVVGGGYGYDGNAGVGVDYYEPFGGVYGAWNPGYQVGPYRDGNHHRGDGGPGRHAYRSAPASRPIPSIPSHSRGIR